MIKRMILMLLAVGLLFGGVFGFLQFKSKMIKQFMASMASPVVTVATTKVEAQDWQPEIKAVGTLRAAKGADLAPEVSGTVEEIHFKSGAEVKEGALLIQLRSDDERARLHALQASAKLADINLKRDQKLLEAQAVSQATVDSDQAALTSAKAQVSEQLAILEKKNILAPFSGRIGIRAVDVGQFINAGTTVVTLQQLDPIYLDFFVPQQDLPRLQPGQKVAVLTDALPGETFDGEVTALNAKVDVATRNILIRATVNNPDRHLLPGMYATIRVASGAPQHLMTLPQTAISYNSYGSTVYIVTPKDGTGTNDKASLVANQTFVTTGPTRGDQIAVLNGVKEGEEIVTAGQLKLHNGSLVTVNNSVQPSNDSNPQPEDR